MHCSEYMGKLGQWDGVFWRIGSRSRKKSPGSPFPLLFLAVELTTRDIIRVTEVAVATLELAE
jgi:hypothetical protein